MVVLRVRAPRRRAWCGWKGRLGDEPVPRTPQSLPSPETPEPWQVKSQEMQEPEPTTVSLHLPLPTVCSCQTRPLLSPALLRRQRQPLAPIPTTTTHDPEAHCPHPGLLRSWLAGPAPTTAGPCLHPLKPGAPGLLWPTGYSSWSPCALLGGKHVVHPLRKMAQRSSKTKRRTSQPSSSTSGCSPEGAALRTHSWQRHSPSPRAGSHPAGHRQLSE